MLIMLRAIYFATIAEVLKFKRLTDFCHRYTFETSVNREMFVRLSGKSIKRVVQAESLSTSSNLAARGLSSRPLYHSPYEAA
jgi:hypothetical protein